MTPNVHAQNAYEILGVPRNADVPAIRRAFKKLAIKYHPDAAPADQKAEMAAIFARINQAHEILKDSDKRKRYDQLLDRGLTPDLAKEIGSQSRFASLADIVGEIRGLDMEVEPASRLLAGIDDTLKHQLLYPNLIRGEGLQESVIDAITFSSMTSKNWEKPPGGLTQGVMVVTELRVIVLMKFVHEYQTGNTRYTHTYWRSYSLPYAGMAELDIHEIGRAFKSYKIELKDEEGVEFLMVFSKRPRLERLFLVANTYRLPLRIKTQGSHSGEYVSAFGQSLIPGLLWCVPFAIATAWNILLAVCSKGSGKWSPTGAWPAIRNAMDHNWITTGVIYLTPMVFVFLALKVHRSWSTGRAQHIFGDLAVDYALGSHATAEDEDAGERGGDARPPASAPAVSVTGKPVLPPPSALPRVPSAPPVVPIAPPAPVTAGPADIAMPESVAASRGTPLAEARSGRQADAADIALPDSVRDAFGDVDAPAPPPPTAFCPRCGSQHHGDGRGMVSCTDCGQAFEVG